MAASKSKGKLVADLLYQSWRSHAPPPRINEDELGTITPLLLGSGAGALAWANIRDSKLGESSSAVELHQAYRLHALHTAAFEDDIKKLITLLRSVNVDPILIKGWAIARLYPDTALRPYGDVDLCVRPSEYAAAKKACESPEGQKYVVDLHDRFGRFDDLTVDELYDRSQIAKLGDVEVRVPCAEHHLRIMSSHMLRHGAWRPLWLCDIAVAIEARPADFDWDLCLGRSRQTRDWVACCVGLAHQLLGAEVDDTPVARKAKTLPGWLISNVMKQWETPYATSQPPVSHRAAMGSYLRGSYLRHPRGLFADLRRRWPNAIEATVYTGGPFNALPRWPFQIGECVARTAKFIARLPRALRDRI
ncbi:MAG TPA: nucleotidyltransferase family protein [Blastocatellia bacterium]|nr:nucleotidyltransferase family protein [Blastocatellia bacterium]